MWSSLDGLPWVILTLIPFIFLQRALHYEMQAVFLLLTRRSDIALAVFSFLLLPGVLLHELSHWAMAKLLRVRTGRFSLLPQQLPDGRLLMGYVETAPTDMLRDALIGAAPLITGGIFVAYAGRTRLGLLLMWDALTRLDVVQAAANVAELLTRPDFWLWFYLTLAVSSTMLPSTSDRRKWLPVILGVVILLALGVIAGAGSWMLQHLAPPLNEALRASAVMLAMSAIIHFVALVPMLLLRRLLSKILRLDVV